MRPCWCCFCVVSWRYKAGLGCKFLRRTAKSSSWISRDQWFESWRLASFVSVNTLWTDQYPFSYIYICYVAWSSHCRRSKPHNIQVGSWCFVISSILHLNHQLLALHTHEWNQPHTQPYDPVGKKTASTEPIQISVVKERHTSASIKFCASSIT